MTRERLAPMAIRTEISRWRVTARDSNKLAMFAHATRRTTPTIAISMNNAFLYWSPVSEKPVVAALKEKELCKNSF